MVRAVLAAAAAQASGGGNWASGIGSSCRRSFLTPGSRPRSPAPPGGHRRIGDQRLARAGRLQPEAARPHPENQRLFGTRVGQPWRRSGARFTSRSNGGSAIDRALARFSSNPMLLQRFHKGRLVEQPYLASATGRDRHDARTGAVVPVLFPRRRQGASQGVLATVCPADKKAAARNEGRRHRAGARRRRWH